ncbi:TldD/PmbA family protein [Actinoplanes regularis]|uniref:Predicted Zn-dependent protease or its inactivated homolog n=1 Tax=Actinoplanes regularis TaxID=52697 RepID=A0A238V7H0_9ACTN|nr:metallopeptidase TldD-related protein [Actinoplanes regularis]GIE83764.1 hypothetical protein Are01nite_02440 [Actinoplanes regularis]SNR30385.1 Predicted Zn-dependent protease or its inactivated homolog [Actinoplanes regularis]
MSAELQLAAKVVELIRELAGRSAEAEVMVRHHALALTRFANSAIHQNVAEATTGVRLRLHLDGRTASGSTTVTGAQGLRSLVERTIAAARVTPPDPGWAGLAHPAALHISAGHPGSGEHSGLAFGFDEATARATPAERAERVRAFVDAAGGLETAGFCRTEYLSAAFANTAGQAVEGRTAEAAMDGIARNAGFAGAPSGLPGGASRDGVARLSASRLADLDGALLGARAAAKARATADAVELPPGQYEVVLEPTAVADLLQNFSVFGFNGKSWAEKQSFAELGKAQFDPSVTIVDDPLGSRGEPAPGLPFDDEGTPARSLVLVRDGVTQAVTHDRTSAAQAGAESTGHAAPTSRSWGPFPAHLRLEAGAAPAGGIPDGPPSIAESARPFVARMRRGLLVTDLWYTRVLDPKTLVVTGLTRNGVWLVEDGEVTRPVGNLRFTQSYPRALGPGRVLGIGAESVLLPDNWGGAHYAAPALHLASWNITGNASG